MFICSFKILKCFACFFFNVNIEHHYTRWDLFIYLFIYLFIIFFFGGGGGGSETKIKGMALNIFLPETISLFASLNYLS